MRYIDTTDFFHDRHQIPYTSRIGGPRFCTTYWYDSVDFHKPKKPHDAKPKNLEFSLAWYRQLLDLSEHTPF